MCVCPSALFLCSFQSWLYTVEHMRGSDSVVLTEDSVKMASHFCLPVTDLIDLKLLSLIIEKGMVGMNRVREMEGLCSWLVTTLNSVCLSIIFYYE